ncbi:pyocin activator PrtN family protein [uncultured Pseudomonas sp.]|uniref:pyocin activator PrtN family protein n=1 Tax=uncultured Pseudomonas sp. TaxID=114707 RepID=UPI0030DB6112
MNTLFLLMAQYNGLAVIPLDRICADYFCHLSVEKLQRKVMAAEIDLPIVRMEGSQKAAKGVHLQDLALYLDSQRARALNENDKLHNRRSSRLR